MRNNHALRQELGTSDDSGAMMGRQHGIPLHSVPFRVNPSEVGNAFCKQTGYLVSLCNTVKVNRGLYRFILEAAGGLG